MFVWIPRYEYKISGTYGKNGTSATSPGEIEVNFISSSTTTATSGYTIHPAFNFGGTALSGIWIGKFQTSGTSSAPTVLPNAAPLTSQSASAQFTTAQVFNSYITGLDAHMMKNSEWGCAAYLSQSAYGKYGNSNYSGAEKEVRINNYYKSSKAMTGCGADSQDASSSITCNEYTTTNGQAASTTGNVTGIYDMSGAAWEQVMGVYNKTKGQSAFSSLPNAKYYDNYTATDMATACSSGICYGHALSETSGWYSDSSYFISSDVPWLLRGHSYNSTSRAGLFATYNNDGSASSITFRIVLS